MYNRARGAELVSPEDLVAAVGRCEQMRLSIKLRKFASGVRVVQSASHSDEKRAQMVLDIVEKKGGGVDELYVSNKLNLSVQLAKEELLSAEDKLLLCRDESLEGLFF